MYVPSKHRSMSQLNCACRHLSAQATQGDIVIYGRYVVYLFGRYGSVDTSLARTREAELRVWITRVPEGGSHSNAWAYSVSLPLDNFGRRKRLFCQLDTNIEGAMLYDSRCTCARRLHCHCDLTKAVVLVYVCSLQITTTRPCAES